MRNAKCKFLILIDSFVTLVLSESHSTLVIGQSLIDSQIADLPNRQCQMSNQLSTILEGLKSPVNFVCCVCVIYIVMFANSLCCCLFCAYFCNFTFTLTANRFLLLSDIGSFGVVPREKCANSILVLIMKCLWQAKFGICLCLRCGIRKQYENWVPSLFLGKDLKGLSNSWVDSLWFCFCLQLKHNCVNICLAFVFWYCFSFCCSASASMKIS